MSYFKIDSVNIYKVLEYRSDMHSFQQMISKLPMALCIFLRNEDNLKHPRSQKYFR